MRAGGGGLVPATHERSVVLPAPLVPRIAVSRPATRTALSQWLGEPPRSKWRTPRGSRTNRGFWLALCGWMGGNTGVRVEPAEQQTHKATMTVQVGWQEGGGPGLKTPVRFLRMVFSVVAPAIIHPHQIPAAPLTALFRRAYAGMRHLGDWGGQIAEEDLSWQKGR